MTTLREVDETELIAHFKRVLPPGNRTLLGSGDDCAKVAAPEGHFIVTTDVLVEGRHFRRDWSSAYDIGQRAAAQNLADIAAMGGRASALVVSLVLPKDLTVEWVVDLVKGFGDRTGQTGAEVVGGDLSGGESVIIAVTAMGYCQGPELRRSGAQPGDTVAIAGTLGQSAAGLDLLLGGHIADPLTCDLPAELKQCLDTYRAPTPPLDRGPAAAAAGAHAMMDVSDGLLIDAGRMAKASHVHIDISTDLLARDIDELATASSIAGTAARNWVLTGGEDHALLATFPADAALPNGFRPIGRVLAPGEDNDKARVTVDGHAPDGRGGWEHFG